MTDSITARRTTSLGFTRVEVRIWGQLLVLTMDEADQLVDAIDAARSA